MAGVIRSKNQHPRHTSGRHRARIPSRLPHRGWISGLKDISSGVARYYLRRTILAPCADFLAQASLARKGEPGDPPGHKVGQNHKTCGFSRGFCHCGPIARVGPKGGPVRKTLDVRALLASGHFPGLARCHEAGSRRDPVGSLILFGLRLCRDKARQWPFPRHFFALHVFARSTKLNILRFVDGLLKST
jgi:hypothetical protein